MPLKEKLKYGTEETFIKLQSQASLQLEGKIRGELIYNFIEPEESYGFYRLPTPNDGDIFFDIESDSFFDDGGLEYLFGYAYKNEKGHMQYVCKWALNHVDEKKLFEDFMDFLTDHWLKYPQMYIYHYGNYEPSALKRLMSRHNTRAVELDNLLRGERFIDLHRTIKQGLQASVENYGLKDMEKFTGYERMVNLKTADSGRKNIEFILELGTPSELVKEDCDIVELYNKDDCLATFAVREWLEEKRKELIERGYEIPRPEINSEEASERVKEQDLLLQETYNLLIKDLPKERSERNNKEQAKWLLAQILTYFQRENKSAWWDFFRMRDLTAEEYFDERKAIGGLVFIKTVEPEGREKWPTHVYNFPEQEISLKSGNKLYMPGGENVGTVYSFDKASRVLYIKKTAKTKEVHPTAVYLSDIVRTTILEESLIEISKAVVDNGISGDGAFNATRDLICKNKPRLIKSTDKFIYDTKEDLITTATNICLNLNQSILAIQGPPGTGKTYLAARMILNLLKQKKKIGVTAISHKVIENLLIEIKKAAKDESFKTEVYKKGSERAENPPYGIIIESRNEKLFDALLSGNVVGGTAWLWSHNDFIESVDYLFIDEAGQFSLAYVLAASRSAKNIILLGDPNQLEQPQKGSHPEGTEIDALGHLLDGKETISEEMGIFLDTTRRMHPQITKFTSEQYYEKKLKSLQGLENQKIIGETLFNGSGLFYVPVEHEGNQNNSYEEVLIIDKIVSDLFENKTAWSDQKGDVHPLTMDNIKIVAPYNAHVAALQSKLKEIQVGTVDKFQGQEAPIIIYSMASSSVEDAPRGMSFILNPSRLNVATSRARCICILVASPNLMGPVCRTPEQMRWANGLCRYVELAKIININ